ncbi:MAG: LysM peptidoglycan-binding domain-containing protein [Firmicutes bacterium]|nr:LysM peptidoglycan-binding domain-containing protein [Bacillota bacterium]
MAHMIRSSSSRITSEAQRSYSRTAAKIRTGISRRIKLSGIFLIVLTAVLIGLNVTAGLVSHSMPESSYETVVVRQGDTLWDIARRARPGTDPRKTIYEIKKLNQLESVNLQPGQRLMIPSVIVCRN